MKQFSLQLRLCYEFMKVDPAYGVCFAGFLISEAGFLLGLVFVNAYIS